MLAPGLSGAVCDSSEWGQRKASERARCAPWVEFLNTLCYEMSSGSRALGTDNVLNSPQYRLLGIFSLPCSEPLFIPEQGAWRRAGGGACDC